MSKSIVVVGGSGFEDRLKGKQGVVKTPFGRVPVLVSAVGDNTIYAIHRHGKGHNLPPHKVRYHANIDVAREVKAEAILASTAVGVLKPVVKSGGGDLVVLARKRYRYIPGDLILGVDILATHLYLDGKPVTFYDAFDGKQSIHADASEIFSTKLRRILLKAASELEIVLKDGAILITTTGPRYETPAEMMAASFNGAHLVGMTTAYEATLALEIGIPYAAVAIGTNWAAGMSNSRLSHDEVIDMMARKGEDVYNLIMKAIEIM